MAGYNTIRGLKVKYLSADPSGAENGQVWYNSTTSTLRVKGIGVAAWSSSATLPGNRTYSGGAGTQTAALAFGGALNPPGTAQSGTFEYNGSGWSSGGDLPAASDLSGGMGTQTAALKTFGRSGGSVTAEAFEYDGSTWTAGGDGGTGRWGVGSAGTQTAGLAFGGFTTPAHTWYANTETYDGTSWSEVADLSTARSQVGFLGDGQTSALCVGGETPPAFAAVNTVEGWNGSAWASETNYPGVSQGGVGTGSETDGFFFTPSPNSTNSFTYNGSAWTAGPSLASGRQNGSRAGTTTAALAFGGNNGSGGNFTEEYNFSANTITAAAFSAGGNLPVVIAANQGGGTQTAGISISGQITGPGSASTTATNEYDGSAWTAGGAVAAGASSYSGYSSQKGTQTSMLFWGGYGNPGGARSTVSSYDGSSWTAQPAFPATIIYGGGAGTQTAALAVGQYGGSGTTKTFEGDGSYNWTAGGDLSTGRYANATCGPQTAAITAGGIGPTAATEVYNGTSWTAGGNLVTAAQNKAQCFGADSSDMVIATKRSSSPEGYDGTAWSTRPSMGTPRDDGGGSGSVGSAGSINGGNVPGFTAATEEFTAETSAANIETLTTS